MADNIYLLETRLSKAQQAALGAVREVSKAKGLTVFLVGGAVRDLIGGTAVRDLDVVVQGNALKIKKDIEKAGAVLVGEMEAGQAFYVRFPGGVRMEIGSTLTVTYPKPGKAVYKPATILEDLRRRDFTANAMALSLNEGSYGLLMDPLNGVADIENRELRLVSNYGFIEDPVRMIRAARLMARLGWGLEDKTRGRYETGKAEGYISVLNDFHRGYETEEIFHEEDALRVMRRLEEEGWMQHLSPTLSALKANVPEMERLRESQAQLQIQGVVADAAAANFPFLTAKMTAKEVEALKKSFPRPGFVEEIEGLEAKGKEFTARLGGKGAALPSQAYLLLMSAEPEAVLWTAHTTKSGALQAKFRGFYTEWPQARQRIPYLLMQEMRILPELPEYEELVEKLVLELMDGRLGTVEEMRAYLEPYSPPAPPPPVSLRRPRAPKKDAKPAKSRKKAREAAEGNAGEAEVEAESDNGSEAAASSDSSEESSVAGPAQAVDPAPSPGSDRSAKVAKAAKTGAMLQAEVPAAAASKDRKGAGEVVPATSKEAAGANRDGESKKASAKAAPAKKPSSPGKSSEKKAAAKKSAVPAKKVVATKKVAAPAKPQKKAAKPAATKAPVKGKAVTGSKAAAKKVPVKGGGKKAASPGTSGAGKKAVTKGRR